MGAITIGYSLHLGLTHMQTRTDHCAASITFTVTGGILTGRRLGQAQTCQRHIDTVAVTGDVGIVADDIDHDGIIACVERNILCCGHSALFALGGSGVVDHQSAIDIHIDGRTAGEHTAVIGTVGGFVGLGDDIQRQIIETCLFYFDIQGMLAAAAAIDHIGVQAQAPRHICIGREIGTLTVLGRLIGVVLPLRHHEAPCRVFFQPCIHGIVCRSLSIAHGTAASRTDTLGIIAVCGAHSGQIVPPGLL